MGRGVSSVGSSLDEGVISFCRVSLYLTGDEKDGVISVLLTFSTACVSLTCI